MNKHVTTIAMVCVGLAIIGIVVSGTIYLGVRWLIDLPQHVRMETALIPAVALPVSNAVIAFLLVGSILNIIAGLGLFARREWGRYLALLIAVFNLFNVPVGTMIGIYMFWALLHDDTTRLFKPDTPAKPEPITLQPEMLVRQER